MFCSVPCCSVYLSPMVALMTNISMNCRTTQSSPRYNHSPRLKKVYWHIAKRWKRDIKRAINGRRKTLSEDWEWLVGRIGFVSQTRTRTSSATSLLPKDTSPAPFVQPPHRHRRSGNGGSLVKMTRPMVCFCFTYRSRKLLCGSYLNVLAG